MDKASSFLTDLASNNNRDWFNANKHRYREALEEFTLLMDRVLDGIREFDPWLEGISAKDSIFRIYRDVRFSRDKSPYKTHFGCWMAKGGRKSTDAGYYFHLEPGASFLAAGSHMPPSAQLKLIREEILLHPRSYVDLVRDLTSDNRFSRYGKEDMLKTGPAGFPKDFEYVEELKYKHHILTRDYSDRELMVKDPSGMIIKDYKTLHPMVEWLNVAMSFVGNQ